VYIYLHEWLMFHGNLWEMYQTWILWAWL